MHRYDSVKFQVAYNQKLTKSTDRDCDTISELTTTTIIPTTIPTTMVPTTMVPTTLPTTTTTSTSTTVPTTTVPTTTTTSTTTTMASSTARQINDESGRKRRDSRNLRDARGDYLLIPNGIYSGKSFASKYCDKSLDIFKSVTGKEFTHINNIYPQRGI